MVIFVVQVLQNIILYFLADFHSDLLKMQTQNNLFNLSIYKSILFKTKKLFTQMHKHFLEVTWSELARTVKTLWNHSVHLACSELQIVFEPFLIKFVYHHAIIEKEN